MKNDRDSLILEREGGEQSVPGCEVAVWRHLGCGSICAATWGDRLCPCCSLGWGSLFCRTPGPAVAARWSCEDMELRGHLGCGGCQFCSREAVLGCWERGVLKTQVRQGKSSSQAPSSASKSCLQVHKCFSLSPPTLTDWVLVSPDGGMPPKLLSFRKL